MSKTALLTGGGGFLGRHVLQAMLNDGWNVLCCTRRPEIQLNGCQVIPCDLNEPAQILALEGRHRPQAIVHLASNVGFGESIERLFVPNILATGCIAYLARVWKARLIFSSSIAVHGTCATHIDENSPLSPDTPYGRSKMAGEELIASSGIDYSIVRIAGIFGGRGPKHLGLNRAIEGALYDRVAPVQIGLGEARRNYVYVKDAALAIAASLESRQSAVQYLSGSEVLSVAEMLQQICNVFLPGSTPTVKDGSSALDQIIVPSAALPVTRSFREALADIKASEPICA